ncbi:MAG: response regulator transcription factor [Chloroflexi bacterium]|nr:response regulator transcription factor [Chloroflexota bacterium]
MATRILIADDHGVLRAGLRALLNAEADLEVVGEAADGNTALSLAQDLHPDVILLDISMPGLNGIEVIQNLMRVQRNTNVLILTVHEDEGLLQEAFRLGAKGYIVKRAVESELINAIRAVSRGDLYVHSAMTQGLVKSLSPSSPRQEEGITALTRREVEVLRLIAQGFTNRQIAEKLSISVRTVESHRANLMSKLDLGSRVELVRYAREHGFLE